MASRRLLDLFALADASAAVVRRHLLLRSVQLDLYVATSSICRVAPIYRHDPATNVDANPDATAKLPQYTALPSKPTPEPELPVAGGSNAERFHLRPPAVHPPHAEAAIPPAKAEILPAKAAIPPAKATVPPAKATIPHARATIPRAAAVEQPLAGGAGSAVGSPRHVPPPHDYEALGQQAFQSRRARGLLAAGSPPFTRAAVPVDGAHAPAAEMELLVGRSQVGTPAANTSQESVTAPVRRSNTHLVLPQPYPPNPTLPALPYPTCPTNPALPHPARMLTRTADQHPSPSLPPPSDRPRSK